MQHRHTNQTGDGPLPATLPKVIECLAAAALGHYSVGTINKSEKPYGSRLGDMMELSTCAAPDGLDGLQPGPAAPHRPRYSVVIPYCNRLSFLERTLKALADQDIEQDAFEVVISSMECSAPFARLVAGMPPRLTVRCIMTRETWNVSRARNLAFAQAEGEILVLLDADMLLPRSFLRTLDENYRKDRGNCALIGQMLGYDCDQEVAERHPLPYRYYRDRHLARNNRDGLGIDGRWTSKRRIPWSVCFSALMVIPKALVEAYHLYFDESFVGWGSEDLEWGYRIHRSGIPIVLADELWGIHMPHTRDVRKNHLERDANYARFLAKWPSFDVELVTRFGDSAANELADEHAVLLETLRDGKAISLLELDAGRGRSIVLGAIIGPGGVWLNREDIPALSEATVIQRMPVLGMRLPYPSQSIEVGCFLSSLRRAPEYIQRLILSELKRVCLSTHFADLPDYRPMQPAVVSDVRGNGSTR